MNMRLPASRYLTFFLISICGLGLDLWSKFAVFKSLGPNGESEWLVDWPWMQFKLRTSFNEGALWGIGQGFAWLFAILSVIAFLGVLYWLFVAGAAQSKWLTVTLALITAGTLGNLYDRLGMHGWPNPNPQIGGDFQAVRDFFYFKFGTFEWAIFNVADICLVVGAIMLVVQSFFPKFSGLTEPSMMQTAPIETAS